MKNTLIAYIMAYLVSFFTDIQSSLFAVGFLIMADTFTGVWAAWKLGIKEHGSFWNGFRAVQSRKAGRIVIKLILYPLAIVVSKVAEEYLSPAIPWVDVTCGILAVVEVKSIFENISKILGFTLWKYVQDRLWKDKIDTDAGK
jgi:hypothetical protein